MSEDPDHAAPFVVPPFTVVDGGLSTALELLGHRSTGLLWTAQLVIDHPEAVVAAHRSFVEAGADLVITSSYQASVEGFVRAGLSQSEAAATLAGTTDLARRSGARYVAASVGPFGATLGDGSEYHGSYDAPWTDVRRFHRERLHVLCESGPDLLAIETIPSRAEAEIVLEELTGIGGVPAWLTMSCRDGERSNAGDPMAGVAAMAAGAPDVVAVGVNCTAPQFVASLLSACAAATNLALVAYPNRGRHWDVADKCWVGSGDADVAADVAAWFQAGARFIGGCCDVGPIGVAEVVAARAALPSAR